MDIKTHCKKILKEDSIINFKESAKDIFAKFRAYNEWPGICFIHNKKVIKIHGLAISSTKSPGSPGDIISFTDSGLCFRTKDYDIVITHLQFPNKNIISTEGEQRYTIMGLGNSTVYGLMVR